ncbi:MAG: glycosyltransferase [Planctomycetia bacterium]
MLRIFESTTVPLDPIPPRPGGDRPRFSVMLPTFDPDEKLRAALRSVLAQGIPPADMQITVVDDNSRPGLIRDVVRDVDGTGRVEVVRHAERLGMAGNWNRAIGLARGDLVHLLHQDDYVLPGFYVAIENGFRTTPQAGMAFCRSRIVDGNGRSIKSCSRLRWMPGVLHNWLPRIVERQRIQTPAAVVHREVYESLGGFRSDLHQALDWEMWVRIASRHMVWYEPHMLAVYRRHAHNESARLLAANAVWPDLIRAIEINARSLPPSMRVGGLRASARWHAASACRTVERLLAGGESDQAAAVLEHVPALLRLAGADVPSGAILRRMLHLRAQISRTSRRAA